MIKLVEAENKYKPDIGDLLCEYCEPHPNKAKDYLEAAQDKPTDGIIPLCLIHPNPWTAMAFFDIDYKPLIARYTCPYTEYEHFAVVPIALILRQMDIERYKKCRSIYSPDYVLDWDFHKQKWKGRLLEVQPIQKLLLGSSYAVGGINDGNGSIEGTAVGLDNGDALWVAFWEWYNK